jgi:hypothetical protein
MQAHLHHEARGERGSRQATQGGYAHHIGDTEEGRGGGHWAWAPNAKLRGSPDSLVDKLQQLVAPHDVVEGAVDGAKERLSIALAVLVRKRFAIQALVNHAL